ncbi:GNAT family N-acetyltransferase [Amycolatopsis aidingensis]|uniref:GNAT family N-acetyltransferase n=1 Tax=Amycolatopsis aidingensis TaxID=2842453 RepID=UPI001C0DC5D3|nr:GNAT family N-acetyltransferase [Amycolatopsis aidingensis]
MPVARVRPVRSSEVPVVTELVHELARHERLRHCRLTADQLRHALNGPARTAFCHVAEATGAVVGFALWLPKFDPYRGRATLYVESLYVRPTVRGSGVGKALPAALAEECLRRGYAGMEWSVLEWNTGAIDFYQTLGATRIDELTRFRLAGTALAVLAGTDEPAPQ